MERLYRITPLEKKSVEFFIDVFERRPDGSTRGWEAHFYYRWGQGFREEDNIPWVYEVEQGVHCDPSLGWGSELDDLCGVDVRFDDQFTQAEQEEIRAYCTGDKQDEDGRWGEAWIFDGDHNWEIEEDCVYIYKPVKIDLVDADGYGDTAIIEADVQPYDNKD